MNRNRQRFFDETEALLHAETAIASLGEVMRRSGGDLEVNTKKSNILEVTLTVFIDASGKTWRASNLPSACRASLFNTMTEVIPALVDAFGYNMEMPVDDDIMIVPGNGCFLTTTTFFFDHMKDDVLTNTVIDLLKSIEGSYN